MTQRANTLFLPERDKVLIKTTLDIMAEALLSTDTALAKSNDAKALAHRLSSAMGPCQVAGCEVCSGERNEGTGKKGKQHER